jgi:hypothetical protein
MSYKSGAPKNERDAKLSRKHLKETIKFNEKHAKDHLKEMKDAKKALAKRIKKY